jgi:hypothetical protein
MSLTNHNTTANLSAHCNSGVGFRSLFLRQGDNSPQLLAVFLCPQFSAQLKFEPCEFTIMVAFFGQPLRLVSPCRDTANLINAAANHFAVLRDGFTILRQGITR